MARVAYVMDKLMRKIGLSGGASCDAFGIWLYRPRSYGPYRRLSSTATHDG